MSIREWMTRQDQLERAVRSTKPATVERHGMERDIGFRRLAVPDYDGHKASGDGPGIRDLRKLGIYSGQELAQVAKSQKRKPELIDGFIRAGTVNVLVGDSGLGKTPLAIQLALSVAGSVAVFGRAVRNVGPVLYCDAESDVSIFHETASTIARFLGLGNLPDNFHVWSPNWHEETIPRGRLNDPITERLFECVRQTRPVFVVVDPLRMFWPQSEKRSDDAVVMFRTMRDLTKHTGCSWLLIHHRRKANQQHGVIQLQDDPHAWLQEAAGSHAIINHTDTRIGVVPHSGLADLLIAGLVRGSGPFVPLDLARATDDDGNVLGYRLLTGVEQLNTTDRAAFDRLAARFRFKDVSAVIGGNSGSNATRFVKRCVHLDIVRKEGSDYVKTNGVDGGSGVSTGTPHTPIAPSVEEISLSELPYERAH